MATFCPYCGKDIEDVVEEKWTLFVDSFDFECPECKKTMMVNVEMDPIFIAHKISRVKKNNDLA